MNSRKRAALYHDCLRANCSRHATHEDCEDKLASDFDEAIREALDNDKVALWHHYNSDGTQDVYSEGFKDAFDKGFVAAQDKAAEIVGDEWLHGLNHSAQDFCESVVERIRAMVAEGDK